MLNMGNHAVLTFTLTTESLLQLTGSQHFLVNSGFLLQGSLLGENGNVILGLPSDQFASFNTSVVLVPGTYKLWENTVAEVNGLVGIDFSQSLSLDANFTRFQSRPPD